MESIGDSSVSRIRHHWNVDSAREEVQDVYVSRDDYRNASFLGGHYSSYAQSGNTFESSFAQQGDCRSGSDDDGETLNLTRLFIIVEEGVPRPNEKMKVEERLQRNETTYNKVRSWLDTHPDRDQRAEALAVRGNNDATPLHNICKMSNPPPDIIEAFVAALPEVASWTDSYGWLPLHFACAYGASGDVLEILVAAFPDGRTTQDSKDCTPLHFFLTRRCDQPNVMAENIKLLLDSGADELADENGMLPMHYACAWGVSPIVLSVLAKAYPNSLVAKEGKGRTPMHLAMVNCHRETGLQVLRFLLDSCGPEIVNARDNEGYLPLHLLAFSLRGYRTEGKDQRKSIGECLSLYLSAQPQASADFLTALQDLPDWLQEIAVISPHVRNVLNKRAVQRFPTSFKLLDGYMRLTLIVCFFITSIDHIDYRFANDPLNRDGKQPALSLLYVGATYFLWREILQIYSLFQLKSLTSYFKDRTNYLDVTVIILVFYYAAAMTNDSPYGGNVGISDQTFRTGVALTQAVLWMSFMSFLRSLFVEFSVFVGGLGYVLKRLLAFTVTAAVTLYFFAYMFYVIYVGTAVCDFNRETVESGEACYFPHCRLGNSFLKVYTMMMGEIGDENRYDDVTAAQIIYFMYAFVVVIILSTILIAIVVDSYEVIQNDRASIVFWTNRLDFVAEMDAISYGIRKRMGFLVDDRIAGQENEGDAGANRRNTGRSKDLFARAWENIMQLFDHQLYFELDLRPTHVDFWCFFLVRALALVFIVPLWIIIGIITVGILWPPQVRERLFAQRETTVSRADLEMQKLNQLKEIQTSIKTLKTEITREVTIDRDETARMKKQIESVQGKIASDLQQVRELLTTLLDMGQSRASA